MLKKFDTVFLISLLEYSQLVDTLYGNTPKIAGFPLVLDI